MAICRSVMEIASFSCGCSAFSARSLKALDSFSSFSASFWIPFFSSA